MVVVGAGNRYLPLDGLVEVSVFDEDGGLTVARWGGGNCIKCLKRCWNRGKGGETNIKGAG